MKSRSVILRVETCFGTSARQHDPEFSELPRLRLHIDAAAMFVALGLIAVVMVPLALTLCTVNRSIGAKAVMILVSLAAMRMAEKEGLWLVLLISFLALPIRGIIAASFVTDWGVFPVQTLDGIGAGLQSVAVPCLVARILNGTGHVNVGQGAVMTVQGVGASLSPAIGGWIAQKLGYPAAFLILGSFAVGSIMIWLWFSSLLKPACAAKPDQGSDPLVPAPAT